MNLPLPFWPAVVTLVLVVGSYVLRKFAPAGHFFHQPLGAFVLALSTGALSTAASAIQTHGLDKVAILQALTGFVISLLATANPSVAPGTTAPMAMRKQSGFVSTRVLYMIAAAALVGMLAAVAFAGCSSCQVPAPTTSQWRVAGVDSAKCILPSVINAAGDAIIAALNQAAGASVDFKQVGIDLAKQYGSAAALCAAGKLWLDLGGPNLFAMHGQPSRALLLTDWLIHHTSEWLPSTDGGA